MPLLMLPNILLGDLIQNEVLLGISSEKNILEKYQLKSEIFKKYPERNNYFLNGNRAPVDAFHFIICDSSFPIGSHLNIQMYP